MCITPLTLKREYRTEKDSRSGYGKGLAVEVPCGKCIKCLRRRQHSWSFRLMQEYKVATSGAFVTLTYDVVPLSFNKHMTLVKKDLQQFIKRLREHEPKVKYIKKNGSTGKKSPIKYYAVGEYGRKRKRPHYHLIIFNLSPLMLSHPYFLTKIWGKGIVDIGSVTNASTAYTAGYIMSGSWKPEQDDDDREPQFSTMSKNLGLSYLSEAKIKYHKQRMDSSARMPDGWKIPLPRYYRDKIFNRKEREILNEASAKAQELNFQKLFNNSHRNQLEWKKSLIRKQEKDQVVQRLKM